MTTNQETLLAQEYNAQGRVLYHADHFEEALSYFKKAEASDPSYRDSYLNQGECLIMLDRFDEAKDAYQKMLLLNKNDGEAYFHLGNVAFLQNDAEAGRDHYAHAVNAGYDDANIYLNMGYILYNDGRYDDAIAQFNKALTRNKFLAQAWLYKGHAHLASERQEEALQAFDGMIQHIPEVFEGHHYKAVLLMQLGRMEEANEVTRRMERMFPDDEAVWLDRLLYLELTGDPDRALVYYGERFGQSKQPRHLMEKAKILLSLKDRIHEGVELLESLAAEEGEWSREAALLALTAGLPLKRFDACLTQCEALLKGDQRDDAYYSALYYKGFILARMGRAEESTKAYETAIAELRMANAQEPAKLDLYILRAMALRDTGKNDKALEICNYLLTLRPDMPEALYMRAEIYETMGRADEARADRAQLGRNPGAYAPMLQYINGKGK